MEPTQSEMVVAAGKAILALMAFGFWLYAISEWLWAATLTMCLIVGVMFFLLWGMFLGV